MSDRNAKPADDGGGPAEVNEAATSTTDCTTSGASVQLLAVHNLARLQAGASDADLDLIRTTWPGIPVNGDNPAADREELQAWLQARPHLMQQVLRMDPVAPPPTIQGDGWPWRSLVDAYKPRQPRQYAVSGILPLPSLTIPFGAPGSLKTMLLMDMALCVAAGQPWLESLPGQPVITPFECMQSAVLWIDVDNGLDRVERRVAAIGKAHKIPQNASFFYVSFPLPPFVASSEEAVKRVVEMATQVGAQLIIVDNLGTVSGGADENSSQMIEVMSGLRQIAENCHAAVVAIHHRTKSEVTRAGNSLRGHSSIEGAVDLALLVEREGDEDVVTLRSTKTRDSPIPPFVALWTYEADGPDLLSGRFWGLGRPEQDGTSKVEKARQAILDHYKPGMNQSAYVTAVQAQDIGRGSTLSALNQLVKRGELMIRDGAQNNEKLYYRPDDVPE